MRISIIGLGHVGSTLAYNLTLKDIADELVLYNRTYHRALGDALDLQHAQSFSTGVTQVRAAKELAETEGSDILIITSSVPFDRDKMKVRNDLAKGNAQLMKELIPSLVQHSPKAVILVVTNPVDVMTLLVLELSGFEPGKVIGIGTLLDSARFRWELSQRLSIHPDDLRAYVLGEHGDTQFAAMSVASAGGEKIPDSQLGHELVEQSAKMGHEIMKAKGFTNYAIASAIALVAGAVAHNSRRTIPVSVWLQNYLGVSNVCLSVPAVVGRQGVIRLLVPTLDPEEVSRLHDSAEAVKKVYASCMADE